MTSGRRLVLAAVVVGAGGVGVACSLLVPLDEVQCHTSADCVARGPAFANASCVSNVCTGAADASTQEAEAATNDAPVEAEAAVDAGPWGCLGSPPESTASPGATIQIEAIVFDPLSYTLGGSVDGGNDLQIISYTPEPNVVTEPCSSLDPSCLNPEAPAVPTNDAGAATLSLHGDFAGFLYMTRSDAFPTLFYPGRLLATEPMVTYPVALLPYSIAAAIGAELSVNMSTDSDGGVGHIFGAVFDCSDRHTGGVSLALTAVMGGATDAGTQFYTRNGAPQAGLTQTDSSGTVAWINIPVGPVTIQPTILGQTTPQLPSYTVYVRPAVETLIYFRPRSRPAP